MERLYNSHHWGMKSLPLIEGWPQIRGYLSTVIMYGNAVGIKVSGRYRGSGH